jgi:hypothetical protein
MVHRSRGGLPSRDRRVATYARSRTQWLSLEPDPLALARARCAEPSGGLDGSQARPWGRLVDIVDEYLREDRPR